MKNAPGADAGSAIWYSSYASPIGMVYMAGSNEGLVEIGLGCGEEEFVRRFSLRYGASVLKKGGRVFAPVVRLLDKFFSGIPVKFDLPLRVSGTPFQEAVWAALMEIPRGETRSYGVVASRVGSPGASRAVGGACWKNPLPIIIPCHRVISAAGRIGGYTGGVEIKRALLAIEGIRISIE